MDSGRIIAGALFLDELRNEDSLAHQKNMLAMGTGALGEHRSGGSPASAHQPMPIDADFHGWALEQAGALREKKPDSIDWQHIAEELELMAAGERRTLRRQLKRLLLHLLKMREQPAQLSRHGGWRRSIRDARDEIEYILEDSPGIFQGRTDEFLADAYARARETASEETKLPLKNFPEKCPWSYEHVMRKDFFPGTTRSD